LDDGIGEYVGIGQTNSPGSGSVECEFEEQLYAIFRFFESPAGSNYLWPGTAAGRCK